MPELIETGHVYAALSPLYSVKHGRDTSYFWDDASKDEFVSKHKGAEIGRFKGLGEMNASDIFHFILNPQTRRLLRVTIEDASKAALVVQRLMGDTQEDKESRKYLMENNGTLDI